MAILLKFLKALNANQHPSQIAFSLLIGIWLGLTPLFFPHTLILLFLIFILRVNFSALIVSFMVFSGLSLALDHVFHQLGLWILNYPALQEFWTVWYNNAFWRFMGFNNSLVMGSILFMLLASLPIFIALLVLVRIYRDRFYNWVNKFKIVRWLKANEGAQFIGRFMS